MNFIKDLTNNIPLLVIMIAIVLLIIVLLVILIVQIARKKKQAQNCEPPAEAEISAETPVSESEDETLTPHEEKQTMPVAVPTEEKQELIKEKEIELMKTEEKVSAKKTEPKTAAKSAPKTAAKPAPKPAPKDTPKTAEKKPAKATAAAKVSNAAGKWVLYEEDRGGYGFRLIANNGEVMLRSSSPYATLQSAKSGIKTYQDNIAADRMEVVETKKGNFFVQINNASKRMLATSADYKNRTSAENAAASIKRWAATTVIVVEEEENK